MRTRILITLALAAALGLAGCNDEAPEAKREVPRNVRVLALSTTGLDEYIEISGAVQPVRGADLSAEESGVVVALEARKGQEVAAGQVVMEQRREILRAERDAAQAADRAQAFNRDKTRRLFEAGKVSELELLNAESAAEQAAAMAAVAAERYERAAISAPFAGIVTDRYVELGQLVGPGQPVARIIDPYTLKLAGHLTDAQVRWVRVGDSAPVALGGSGVTAVATVTWIGLEADRATGKFPVELEIPNPELDLRSGVIGRARLPKNSVSDVVVIPRDAVLESKLGTYVYVVEGDRAARRDVQLGADQGLMTVVLSGLAAGDDLVVRGQRDLSNGSLVQVTERSTEPDGGLPGDPDDVRAVGARARLGGDPALTTEPEAGR